MPAQHCFPRLLAAVLGAALLTMSVDASALSRRDQAAVDAITARMEAAETAYKQALVKMGNADPAGSGEADKALEDMEDVVAACSGQRGCSVPSLLSTYKRLLKLTADIEGSDLLFDELPPGTAGHHITSFAEDVPEAARAAALLDDDGHRFDRMVQYNPAVQEGIRRWLTDMRGALLTSYENYQYMRHLMWPQYERAGLPEALLFGILAKESNGRVHSTSRAGAAGPLQFMYATGKRFGLGDDGTGFDTRYDAYAASEASVSYLNERMRELNGNIELALAAYNGGEGRALRVYQGAGGKGFWDADVYAQFPPETRDYVPMVIAAAWLFLHPDEYGLTLPKVDPKPVQLRLEQPASIYQLTICLGNRGVREGYMRALRNYNPRYQADDRLPAGTILQATTRIAGLYKRQCIRGPRADMARELVASEPGRAIR
ncbi:transglycosylase SLT domain-containing protein [Lysobacter sp. H21R4]|nr:transglycosylase SLT domain-containing protein [Lysobacter sp. H21R4]